MDTSTISSRKTRKDTDEWNDSSLHLVKIEEEGEGEKEGRRTHTLKWIVKSYDALATGMIYNSHYVRIGKMVHRLRILRSEVKGGRGQTQGGGGTPKRPARILLGLTPTSACAEVTFTILGMNQVQILPLERLTADSWRAIPNRRCFSEFREIPACFLQFNELTAHCRVSTWGDSHVGVEIVKDNAVATDLGRLFRSGTFSDLTVVAGPEPDTRRFGAHRVVLCARSPVLRAMFESGMAEARDGHLRVEDADPDAVGEFLHYLYSGRTSGPLTVELALGLLPLADRYDVPEFRAELADYLCCNLSARHALHILAVADLHGEKALRREAVQFVGDHLWQVMQQPGWSDFRTQLNLVDAILAYLA